MPMIHAWLVDDEAFWQKAIKKRLASYDIEVSIFADGESLLNAIIADVPDECDTALIDWRLYEKDGRTTQPMQGGKIYWEIKRLKPYLPQFVITQVDDLDEITNTILLKYRFNGFFSKEWLQKSKDDKVDEFVAKIREAAQEMRESLTSFPSHASWDKYKQAYFAIRFSDHHDWQRVENEINEEVQLLLQADFAAGGTLARRLPIVKSGEVQIVNILAARRVIFSQIFLCGGRWHEVETFLGYEEEPDMNYDNPFRIHSGAFRTYCNALGIKPDEFKNAGEGLLAEEVRWLRKFCKESKLKYGFPIA